MTMPTQLVLRALLEDPAHELYGVEIGAAAGLPSGTIHPILARLEGLRWLESRWEDIDPGAEGRPARRACVARTVELAVRVLPAEHRQRYGLELIVELCGMPKAQQRRHSARVLTSAWHCAPPSARRHQE